MALQNCVVCGQRQEGLLKLLTHFSSSKEYKYIHKFCLMFYKSDWNQKTAANEELYLKDFVKTCTICNKKTYQQVMRCADRKCHKRFHFDCLTNPVIVVNAKQKSYCPRLLIYCAEHSQKRVPTPDIEKEIELIYASRVEYQNYKKQQKHKHSRSRSHNKKKSHKNLKFSSEEKSKDSFSEFEKTSKKVKYLTKQNQPVLTIQENKISNYIMEELRAKANMQIEVPPIQIVQTIQNNVQEEKKQEYIPIQKPLKIFERQQIYPELKKVIDDPEFPFTEREAKRDQSILKWWDKIDDIYFNELNQLPITKEEKFENPFDWYNQELDEELLDWAEINSYEPLIQIRYLYKDSLNIVVRCPTQSYHFIRYNIIEHASKEASQGQFPSQIKIYRYPFDHVLANNEEKCCYSLQIQGICELSSNEYQQLLKLEENIVQQQQILEQSLDIEMGGGVQQLDIVYHVLKDELNEIVQTNNQKRIIINKKIGQRITKTMKQEQQLIIDLLQWGSLIKAFINGYKDKEVDVLNTFYPYLQFNQQNSQKAQLKRNKIHSRDSSIPLDTDCKICFDYHYTDINPVIYCGKCQTSFHKICYGLGGTLPDDEELLCDVCSFDKNYQFTKKGKNFATCRICKKRGWPQKYLKNKFYHVSCLLLTNQIIIQNGTFALRNKQVDLKQLIKDNENCTPQCAVCGDTKGYRFICCGGETIPCRHAFHPICAYLHGLSIDIQSDNLEYFSKNNKFASLTVQIKCVLHCGKQLEELLLQSYYRRFALNYEQTAKCGGEQLFMEDFKKTKGYRYLSLKLPILRNDTLLSQIYNQHGTPQMM